MCTQEKEQNQEYEIEKINPELYSQEDINSLANTVAVYISAFSKEPFNEKWENITDSDFNPNDIFQLTSFLNDVLSRPNDLVISGDKNTQTISFDGIEIQTKYPLSSIVNSYAKCLNNDETVLLTRSNGKIYHLSSGQRLPVNSETSDATVRLINYFPEENIGGQLYEEIGYYLDPNDKEDFLNSFENTPTVYFAEVVNLSDKLAGQAGFIMTSFREYFTKYQNRLPKQIVYMTKPGTSIENDKRDSKFMDKILKKSFPKNTIEKKQKVYSNGETIIYIYNIR